MAGSTYNVTSPETLESALVFASPHSGRKYTPDFLRHSVLDERTIRSSEDAYVDHLFGAAPEFGAPFITATAPRAFLDLNRSPDELDPALITGVRSNGHNPRIASGLGVIPRVVAGGRAIYRGKMSRQEAEQRIESYWHPYHNALQGLLDRAHARFGQAILIDCHSMPHEAMDGIARGSVKRPDVVLGDRFGAAASERIVDQVEEAFTQAGFTVTRNAPFAGAYITQSYGRPSRQQHAIQVEIDRSLYMNERRVEQNANFQSVRLTLRQVISEISQIGLARIPLAAE
ncbi:MAG: N-formylglutamate amidohydrolase [Paracoccaceae bacterium]